jgi:hypothetical protein
MLVEQRKGTKMPKNNMCDTDKCTDSHGEVRVYPLSSGGNLILCQACWAHENRYRWQRAFEYNGSKKLDIAGTEGEKMWPQENWYEAEVYETA